MQDQAYRSPAQLAVVSGGHSMTYALLHERSNQLAHLLISRGISKGKRVGMGLDRCLELPVALLGIIKSGASYVPLDPTYPALRLEKMCLSAELECVITTPELAAAFPAGAPLLTISDAVLSEYPRENPHVPLTGQDPLYAIFTSGSTGEPKAASVFHQGFENLLSWYTCELSLTAGDSTLVISSPSFDLTQKNFYAPLLTGGRLVLDTGKVYDISRITQLIQDHRITLINCTPSAFYPLVDAAAADGFQALSTLRFAVLGGEPISVPRLRAWLEHPNCRAEVVNSYGPTECTDICLFHRLHRENLDEFPFVPLGREIPHVSVTVRDDRLAVLPDGETGELCIQGISLGGGYLNDPAKTADCFISGIYRTGDLAKRLPCGTFEFRGRADYQVKINGFRIELGEIEIALGLHESIREAVVIARENRLIAYIQGDISVATVRDHLSARIPTYMIPGEFIFLENFPLTPNGKIDRNSLAIIHKNETVIPSGCDLESQILALWTELLNHPVADPTANFFDLGGNSIHLAVMHVRLTKMTGRDFPITELFALPTARAIATFLSPKATSSTAPTAQDRARLAQAGFSRFRRAPIR